MTLGGGGETEAPFTPGAACRAASSLPEPLNRQHARNTYKCGIDEKQDDREHRVSLEWFTHRVARYPTKYLAST
jgi:hypothetical protein